MDENEVKKLLTSRAFFVIRLSGFDTAAMCSSNSPPGGATDRTVNGKQHVARLPADFARVFINWPLARPQT
jgi:hypothetical protein